MGQGIVCIVICSIWLLSCKPCPKDTVIDKKLSPFLYTYVAGIEDKTFLLTDESGMPYYVKVSKAMVSRENRTSGPRPKGGMFSCDKAITVYESDNYQLSFESNIPDFKWAKAEIKSLASSEGAVVWLYSSFPKKDPHYQDDVLIISHTLPENSDSLANAVFIEPYHSLNKLYDNANVIVTGEGISDSLFWNREKGILKFTSKTGKQYFVN